MRIQSSGPDLKPPGGPQPPVAAGGGRPAAAVVARDTAPPSRPRLTGAFLQLGQREQDEAPAAMVARLTAMKAAGMTTVIIQYSGHNGTDLGAATEKVLAAADRLGMKVWVGAPLDETHWWTRSWSPAFLRALTPPNVDAVKAIVAKVADHPSLAGLYLPYETSGLASPWAMGDFYGALAQAAKEARPGLPVMISPYSNLEPGRPLSLPSWLQQWWWGVVLGRAKVDVLAWQDGVGGTDAQLKRIDHDLGAIARAAKRHDVALWANVEAFDRTSPLNRPFEATSAPFDRLQRQLAAVAPYTKDIVCFDFNDYMDPAAGDAQARLYEAYSAYVKQPDP